MKRQQEYTCEPGGGDENLPRLEIELSSAELDMLAEAAYQRAQKMLASVRARSAD